MGNPLKRIGKELERTEKKVGREIRRIRDQIIRPDVSKTADSQTELIVKGSSESYFLHARVDAQSKSGLTHSSFDSTATAWVTRGSNGKLVAADVLSVSLTGSRVYVKNKAEKKNASILVAPPYHNETKLGLGLSTAEDPINSCAEASATIGGVSGSTKVCIRM
jgi:hypothetical protein